MFLIPIDDIIPNSRMLIPPMTGAGIVAIRAVNFGINGKDDCENGGYSHDHRFFSRR